MRDCFFGKLWDDEPFEPAFARVCLSLLNANEFLFID